MRVEYGVIKVVSYVGDPVLDVPDDAFDEDGDIRVEWAREHIAHEQLDVDDTDILDESRCGHEYAIATPTDDPVTLVPVEEWIKIRKLRKRARRWKRRARVAEAEVERLNGVIEDLTGIPKDYATARDDAEAGDHSTRDESMPSSDVPVGVWGDMYGPNVAPTTRCMLLPDGSWVGINRVPIDVRWPDDSRWRRVDWDSDEGQAGS